MKKVTVRIGDLKIETDCRLDIEVREIFDCFQNSELTAAGRDVKSEVNIEVGQERLEVGWNS